MSENPSRNFVNILVYPLDDNELYQATDEDLSHHLIEDD